MLDSSRLLVGVVVGALAFAGCPAPATGAAEGEGGAGEGEGEGEGAAGEGEGAAGEGEGEGGGPTPTVTSTIPGDGDSSVATNTVLSVAWSEGIDCSTVVAGTVVMQLDDATQLGSTVDCQGDGATFHITPSVALPANQHVTAAIVGTGIIASTGGAVMAADFIWSFTTASGADTTPPSVVTLAPADQSIGVATNTSVSATFDESLDCSTAAAASSLSSGAAVVTCSGATITMTPSAALPANTVVTATIGTGVTDLAGNAITSAVTWTFTTGAAADTTPPSAPVCTTFTTPTLLSSVQISGTKDALEATDVEERVSVNGGAQTGLSQIVATGLIATWTASVPLVVGDNAFEILSKDAAGNASTTTTFLIHRDPNPVGDPVITQIVNSASVASQVIEGTKDAQTAVLMNGTIIVPQSAATTWDALITVSPGANLLAFKAQDGGGNQSNTVNESVTFTDPGALSAGEVKITFDVVGVFSQMGDENGSGNAGAGDEDHAAVNLWIEGPYEDRSGAPESCYYDAVNQQRKYTRHVRTIQHTAVNGATCTACNGPWGDDDWRDPDFFAALVESGRWASVGLTAGIDRRGTGGHRFNQADAGQTYWTGTTPKIMTAGAPIIDGITAATLTANGSHFITSSPVASCGGACSEDQHCVADGSACTGGNCAQADDERQSAVVCLGSSAGAASTVCTGVHPFGEPGGDDCGNFGTGSPPSVIMPHCDTTQATHVCHLGTNGASGTNTCRAGQVVVDVAGTPTCRGESLIDWHRDQTFRWDLKDRNGQAVHDGWYLVWVSVQTDRNPTRALNRDLEVCWDDPTQDTTGQHRAVAAIHVDGATATTVFADEKGREPIQTCSTATGFASATGTLTTNPGGTTNRVACSCPQGTGDLWPCPAVPNSASGNVHLLKTNYRGSGHALSVQYCPSGACP